MDITDCPLKVNPIVILKKRAKGDFLGAYKYYKSRVFFPGIVSRICSKACVSQKGCLKNPQYITSIEQACANFRFDTDKEPLEALSEYRYDAAVIGGGLAGVAAAMLLRKEGYRVHLYEQKGKLGGRYGQTLSETVLREELYNAIQMPGINVFFENPITDPNICSSYDIVCNTGIDAWRELNYANLFHAFGKKAEGKIAAAIETEKKIEKYLKYENQNLSYR